MSEALFGVRNKSLGETKAWLEEELTLAFVQHDSSYFGGDYYLCEATEGEFRIVANVEDEEGELIEPTFPDFPVLVYVSAVEGSPLLMQVEKLEGTIKRLA